MQQLWPIMAVQGLVIAAIALGAAWLTERAFRELRGQSIAPADFRGPGWCGAMIAGLVIGAALHSRCPLNRVDPIFNGGQTEQRAIDDLMTKQKAEREALAATGVTPQAVEELDQSHSAAIKPLVEAHTATVQRHHDATRWLTLLGGALLLLIAGAVKPKRLGDALPVAIGAAVCVGGGAFAAAWLLGLPHGLAVACACAAAAVPVGQRYAATVDEAGASLVGSTAWWLLTLALAAAAGLDAKFGPGYAMMGLFIALALLARALDAMLNRPAWRLIAAMAIGAAWFGWLGGALIPGAWLVGLVLVHANIDLHALRRLVDPIVALMIAMSVNVAAGFSPWLLLALLIVMCDLRALGAWGATRALGGKSGLIYGCVLAIVGPTSLVVAWQLHDAKVVDDSMFSALLLAALISGLLAPVALRWARQLTAS